MKGGASLNPHAESYIPLSKRGTAGAKTRLTSPAHESKDANEVLAEGHFWEPSALAPQGHGIHNVGTSYPADNTETKDHDFHGFIGSSSYNPGEMTDKAHADDEFELHLAYLQAAFPSVSYESLLAVFVANNCDFDVTVDVLDHLELYSGDSSAKLPDTLDIGDAAEPGLSSDAPAQKSKNVNTEAGASSSHVSDSATSNLKF